MDTYTCDSKRKHMYHGACARENGGCPCCEPASLQRDPTSAIRSGLDGAYIIGVLLILLVCFLAVLIKEVSRNVYT